MKLLLLGTAGYHPSATRQTACLMIPEAGIVLDAGTGMFRVRDAIATRTLDIFLTHAHLDHVVGLTYLIDVLHGRQMDRVTVHGDATKLAAVREHLFAEALFPVEPACEFCPLAAAVSLGCGGTLTHFPLAHPGGVVGFRLDWPGHSLAYVTDTTASEDAPYVAAIRGVNLLVHECNFPDAHADLAALTGHSNLSPVARLAKRAGVGQLVLTHVNPLTDGSDLDLAAAGRIFGRVSLGQDGQSIEF